MVNEAAFCLEDGVVGSPGKLDLAMILGTGFPPYTGGLLRWADSLGLTRVRSLLEELTGSFGPRFEPARSIRRMADGRGSFYSPAAASPGTEAAS
jgi:3-hydroxyacyl-CoA dehydrogenase/enoyl-CoA hydratase/3-hydroxybutyryl-CoA epimerase